MGDEYHEEEIKLVNVPTCASCKTRCDHDKARSRRVVSAISLGRDSSPWPLRVPNLESHTMHPSTPSSGQVVGQ